MAVAVSQEYPLLDGNAPSWADITTTINVQGGGSFKDIDYKELKWSSTVARGEQRGASGGRVIRRTTGELTEAGSAIYYRSGLRKLLKEIYPLAPVRGNQRLVSLVTFNVVVLHTVPGDDEIYHHEMRGCRLSSFDATMTQGTDAEEVAMDLAPLSNVQIIGGVEIVLL
jgi:hypothetical protein